ncbi:IPT/TIG domain-containing protein [Nocardia sp. NPDC005745]|uniref:IPT/TIG domain-containing protein n=1 Tax=Nocardia sp. NPDC005745 TaxID=3157061 RepID=UPI003408A83E
MGALSSASSPASGGTAVTISGTGFTTRSELRWFHRTVLGHLRRVAGRGHRAGNRERGRLHRHHQRGRGRRDRTRSPTWTARPGDGW